MSENVTNIISKIEKYDEENKTEFTEIVSKKLETAVRVDSEYYRGILHGILLILTSLEVITPSEAIDIMSVITPNMEEN